MEVLGDKVREEKIVEGMQVEEEEDIEEAGYSRMNSATLLYYHIKVFEFFAGIPDEILYDTMKTHLVLRRRTLALAVFTFSKTSAQKQTYRFVEIMNYMLEKNQKLEQEIISWNEM